MDKSSLLWIFMITACTVGSSDDTKRFAPPCILDRSPQQACSLWRKFPDGQTDFIKDLCYCANGRQPACNANWEQNSDSGAVLTYRSLENRDETYQYQFCASVFGGKRTCKGNETAAIIQVSLNPSVISLAESVCRCPSNRPYEWVSMQVDERFHLHIYTCEKPDCTSNVAICAVREKSSPPNPKDKAAKSLCNCQPGKGCVFEDPVKQENNKLYYKCRDIPHTG